MIHKGPEYQPLNRRAFELITIPEIGPDKWPDIEQITFGCLANQGRSIIGEQITIQAIENGRFPKVKVDSGALLPHFYRDHPKPNPKVIQELLKRGHGPQVNMLRSKPLWLCNISNQTDLVFFVNGDLITYHLPDHNLHQVKPRSIISIRFPDPYRPSAGQTMEEAISETYERIHYLINHQLLGIITNVRKGKYINRRYNKDGIIYPFGYQEPEFPLFGEGELS